MKLKLSDVVLCKKLKIADVGLSIDITAFVGLVHTCSNAPHHHFQILRSELSSIQLSAVQLCLPFRK